MVKVRSPLGDYAGLVDLTIVWAGLSFPVIHNDHQVIVLNDEPCGIKNYYNSTMVMLISLVRIVNITMVMFISLLMIVNFIRSCS